MEKKTKVFLYSKENDNRNLIQYAKTNNQKPPCLISDDIHEIIEQAEKENRPFLIVFPPITETQPREKQKTGRKIGSIKEPDSNQINALETALNNGEFRKEVLRGCVGLSKPTFFTWLANNQKFEKLRAANQVANRQKKKKNRITETDDGVQQNTLQV